MQANLCHQHSQDFVKQSFTAHVPLLKAITALGLGRTQHSFPQQHLLPMLSLYHKKN